MLDASAILGLLGREPGADVVAESIGTTRCILSAVNLAEVATKLALSGLNATEIEAVTEKLGVEIIGFDQQQAIAAGRLVTATRAGGLSLGDRACIQLAQLMNATVLTSDRIWSTIGIARIRLIR